MVDSSDEAPNLIQAVVIVGHVHASYIRRRLHSKPSQVVNKILQVLTDTLPQCRIHAASLRSQTGYRMPPKLIRSLDESR